MLMQDKTDFMKVKVRWLTMTKMSINWGDNTIKNVYKGTSKSSLKGELKDKLSEGMGIQLSS